MKWGGALVALLLCLAACLLVVALRIRTLGLRELTQVVHRESLHLEAERARLVRRIALLERVDELRSRGVSEEDQAQVMREESPAVAR